MALRKQCGRLFTSPLSRLSKDGTIDDTVAAPMICFKTGDILAEDSEALVNAVNCAGIMGRGIALQFK